MDTLPLDRYNAACDAIERVLRKHPELDKLPTKGLVRLRAVLDLVTPEMRDDAAVVLAPRCKAA